MADLYIGENDERELLWASLEKLPTYTRLRTAVLTKDLTSGCDKRSEIQEEEDLVDVSELNDLERRRLVERAFETNEIDNAILLENIRNRLGRVRCENPTVEVRFQNLSVNANVYTGKRALPSLPNYVRNKMEAYLEALKILPSQQHDFAVLDNVNGFVRPGRMTLLLGPPGSGKTTLLLALAGKLDKNLRTSGEITYNGQKFSEFVVQRTSAYVSQTDSHIGDLTVRETLDFAARCQGVGCSYAELAKDLEKREREMKVRPDAVIDAFIKAIAVEGKKNSISTDYILKMLGLEICADTKVGSEMARGISGGQKKRVTTGEMVVGPKRTLFMDEISTGLDSSTTYQVVKCIGNFVRIMDGTVLMALLQPAPETFDLFDDIILLSEGQIVYQGPRERVLEFFESLGFVLPPRKGVADFLQEVTSRKDQEQYWADKTKEYEFVPISKMVEAFNQSEFGKDIEAYLSFPNEKSTSHPRALAQTKYALPTRQLLEACAQRELVLIYRSWFLYVFRTCQVGFVAFITCTLFLRTRLSPTDENNGNLYLSSLFFSLVHMMFNGFSEMPILIERLPIFYKQRDNNFYPAWAFSIPSWILRIPYSIVEAIIWSCVVYYTVGLDPDIGRFFRYMLLLFLIHQMAIGLFRLIGSLSRTMIVANTFGTFGLLLMFLLGGFILSKGDIGPWWVWAYWLSPLSYGQNALSVNEFLAPRWNKTSPSGHGTLGSNVLEAHGLFRRGYWYWVGVGVLIGYTVLFNFLGTLALRYLQPLGKPQAMVPEDVLKEKTVHRSEKFSSPVNGDLGSSETDQRQTYQESVPNEFDVLESNERNAPKTGMILPFEPLAMTFYNINYDVDVPREIDIEGMERNRLRLLCDVSGVFRPGVLTALVGVSGAGKTTLMDVLAGRKTGGYIEGQIRISGYPKVQETFARISGYVEQTDIHSPQVTVEESLVYSSWLRLPRDVDKETREAFVNEVMRLVELDSLRDALVGLPGSAGLSTEQRKRLTIAVELVANPSIIFMDEPTSGLDARAAAIVMRTVRNTVDTGRTVVCTIHQPSIDIFEAFDELLLMKRGGQVIYGGLLGPNSQQMIDYFQAIPGVPAIKDGYNPATWMLEISTQAAEQRIGEDFATIYKNSDLYKRTEALIQELSIPVPGSKPLSFPTQFAQSIFTQFHACYWKQNVSYWRNPHYNVVRIFFSTICALIFGSVFWDRGSKRDTVQDLFNVMGALFAAVLFVGVNNASSVQPVVSVERTVYYREKATGMYAAFPYALAQGLVEVPYILVQTLIYGTITYFMINFEKTAGKFFLYLLFMFLTFTYCTFYGMMAIGLTPSQQLAAVVSSAFYSIWNLLSGFLIPKPKIPGWWIWFYYICPFAWTLNGIISSQLGDVDSELNDANFHGSVKDFIKSYLGYHRDQIGMCVGILVAFSALFFGVFAVSIKVLNFQRR